MLKLYDQRIAENEFGELFVNVRENGSIKVNEKWNCATGKVIQFTAE